MTMNTEQKENTGSTADDIRKINTKATVLLILSVVLLLLLVLHSVLCPCKIITQNANLSNETIPALNDPANGDTVTAGNIPNLNDEDVKAALKQKQDDSYFTVQVVSEGEIKAGSQDLYLTIANPQSNKQDCRIHLYMGGEKLYTSPVMPPKTYITHETLNKALEPGKHTVNVQYAILDESGKESCITEVEAQIICK